MARIFVGLLMILCINGQTTADEKSPVAPELLDLLMQWGTRIFRAIQSFKNGDECRADIRQIMKQVHFVSERMDALDNQLGIRLETMLNTFLFDIHAGGSLPRLHKRLRHGFTKIDNYFDLSREYKFGEAFGNETLSSFAHKALWGKGSVAEVLNEIYKIFFWNDTSDSYISSTIHQHAMINATQHCDTHLSPQQKIYYIYTHLIITEIKGLLTQQHCLNIKHLFDDMPLTYVDELNRLMAEFEKRAEEYHKLFADLISRIPQQIRRCDVNSPQRGVHFLELQKFSRVTLHDSKVLSDNRCLTCPKPSELRYKSLRTNTTIYDCKAMGEFVTVCPARNSHRKYLWWEDADGGHYGLDAPCPCSKQIMSGSLHIYTSVHALPKISQCTICACSTDFNGTQIDDDTATWRISLTEQISEIMNNKVVTGVRFLTQNNSLHIQIRQAQFSLSGMIYNTSGWKDLEIGYHCGNMNEVYKMKYASLRHDRKSLYLDDIKLPEGYVVTGVRFKLVEDSAFKLQILATQFNFKTGELNPYVNVWHDASTYPMKPSDYTRNRREIQMDSSDDPWRTSNSHHDLESNKLVAFTHSDIYEDGGQTTIPLLDAQPVITEPSFPLSGIGVSFREKESFGGYIALHINTLDVIKHMELPKVHSVMTDQSWLPEEKEFPLSTMPSTAPHRNESTLGKPWRYCWANRIPHVIQV